SYLELDMYASLEVHTATTISDGKEELKHFSKLINEYETKYSDKSWNFPKNHTHGHLFKDIEEKGVTQNYNTKFNEKAHGPLKTSY
ncbi:hypothetical protein BDZ94DRAFT_1146294, partial [Collybia nuda]